MGQQEDQTSPEHVTSEQEAEAQPAEGQQGGWFGQNTKVDLSLLSSAEREFREAREAEKAAKMQRKRDAAKAAKMRVSVDTSAIRITVSICRSLKSVPSRKRRKQSSSS